MTRRILLGLIAVPLLACTVAWAQPASGQKPAPDKGKPAKKPAPAVTPEREAAAMAFVKQHHAELGDLLTQLKAGNPKDYEQAVRELSRVGERLAQVQEKDSKQYALELRLWQSQSRVQLLTARIKMADNKELREQLRAALNERLDARLAVLSRERERVQQRLGDIDEQMKKLEDGRQKAIDRQVDSLTSTVKPKPGKPAANKKNDKSKDGEK